MLKNNFHYNPLNVLLNSMGDMSITVTWVMAIGADPAYPLAKGHNGHEGLSHAAAGSDAQWILASISCGCLLAAQTYVTLRAEAHCYIHAA